MATSPLGRKGAHDSRVESLVLEGLFSGRRIKLKSLVLAPYTALLTIQTAKPAQKITDELLLSTFRNNIQDISVILIEYALVK